VKGNEKIADVQHTRPENGDNYKNSVKISVEELPVVKLLGMQRVSVKAILQTYKAKIKKNSKRNKI
jgi:hypothetical protein